MVSINALTLWGDWKHLMARTPGSGQVEDLPDEILALLVGNWTLEFASLKGDGTPVTVPLIPSAEEERQTIDVNTGLAYPTKAERCRNNPRVCLLYSEPVGAIVENPPVVLVYGHATVCDADLQANTDRVVRFYLERGGMFAKMPRFMFRQAVGYLARIWIAVTPLRVLWWPNGDMEAPPGQWTAPEGKELPASDPKPEPLSEPHKPLVTPSTDWRSDIGYAIDTLGPPVLTVVDDEGYPVPFRVREASLRPEGVQLRLLPAMPAQPEGRACLTFHTIAVKDGSMVSNENMAFLGEVSGNDGTALFRVERRVPDVSLKLNPRGIATVIKVMLGFRKRLEIEAARRGQPVPAVRLPDEQES